MRRTMKVRAAPWSTVDTSAPHGPHVVDPTHGIFRWKIILENRYLIQFCKEAPVILIKHVVVPERLEKLQQGPRYQKNIYK
jgi:hypothetical protein